MRPFGLVFVVFEPDEAALANLTVAHRSCARTIVVDNTPQPDPALHERLVAAGITTVCNYNHGGLGGAYNRGVRLLMERSVELSFLLDQDSVIEDGYFDRMTAAAEAVSGAVIIAPLVHEIELGQRFPQDLAPPTIAGGGLCPTTAVISSGSAISTDAYRRIGPFREDLFIEYIDTEYSIRAGRLGVPMYVHPAEVLRQRTGAITTHRRGFTTNHVASRRYYLVRNVIAVGREYAPIRDVVRAGILLSAREISTVLRYDADKLRKLVAIAAGTVDGFCRRLGRFEDNHPRVQQFCTRDIERHPTVSLDLRRTAIVSTTTPDSEGNDG